MSRTGLSPRAHRAIAAIAVATALLGVFLAATGPVSFGRAFVQGAVLVWIGARNVRTASRKQSQS